MPEPLHNLMSYLRVAVGICRNDPRDDAELLARFAETRDESAFATLVSRHGKLVWRTCKIILQDTPDAEDVFQTVFLTLARKANRISSKCPAGWLHQVARRAALNVRAATRRRENLKHKLLYTPQINPKDVDQTEQHALLDEELAGLPEKLRIPLVLRYLEEKTLDEVARIVGCSHTSVQRRLAKAEAVLRDRLGRRGLAFGVTSVAALLGNIAKASALPAGLIASTVRAAVAFRAGTLAGTSADAAEKLLRSLSVKGVIGKSWWLVLAAGLCSLGSFCAGLIIWKVFVGGSDGEVAPAVPLSPPAAVTSLPHTPTRRPGVDFYGDPLPKDAIARIGTTRFRVSGRDDSLDDVANWFNIALSPDGKVLASSHGPYAMEAGNQKQVAIRFWELATGRQLYETVLEDSYHKIPIAFTSDGKTLIATTNKFTWLIDTATGQPSGKPLTGDWPFALSSDSKMIAVKDAGVSGAGFFKLYNLDTRKPMDKTFTLNPSIENSNFTLTAFSPDGRSFACVEESEKTGVVHLLDFETGAERATLKGQQVVALRFTRDSSNLITAGRDKLIRVWNAKTGEEVRQLGNMAEVPLLAGLSADGKTVLAACAGQIRRWDLATGKETQHALDCKGLLWPRVLSADGTKLIENLGSVQTIWDTTTGREIGPAAGAPRSHMELLTFSRDGKSLATLGRGESKIQLWEAATGKPLGSLPVPASMWGEIAWPVRDKLITRTLIADQNGAANLQIVQLTRGAGSESVVDTRTHSDSIKFSPDGQVLARFDGKDLELLEVATGKRLSTVPCPLFEKSPWELMTLNMLIFSADHRLLATHSWCEPTVTLWEVSTGRKLYSFSLPLRTDNLPKNDDEIYDFQKYDKLISFSPDGRLIVTQDGKTRDVSLWEHVSGQLRLRLSVPPGSISAYNEVALSPDSRLLAMGSMNKSEERSIHIWDLVTGQECQHFQGHKAGVVVDGAPRVVFSPNGRLLASAGMDHTVLIWDVHQPSALATLSQPLDPKELQILKNSLFGADAAEAYRAISKLQQVPEQAVPLAAECLRPQKASLESKEIFQEVDRLIIDLDSDDFQTRSKADKELGKMLNAEKGEPVIQLALRQALTKKTSAEVRTAIKRLLDGMKEELKWGCTGSPELTRMFRAIEVLERINNAPARELLQNVIESPPHPEVRQEAEAALKRLTALPPGRISARR